MPSPSDVRSSTHSSARGPSDDIGLIAQRAAEKHIERLDGCLYDEQDGVPDVQWPESAGPYCGCTTCQVREILWIVWPIIEQDARRHRPAR